MFDYETVKKMKRHDIDLFVNIWKPKFYLLGLRVEEYGGK